MHAQTYSFENLVHSIVWRVGRNFGFQAFNQNPLTADRGYQSEWVAATIFVASDHLVSTRRLSTSTSTSTYESTCMSMTQGCMTPRNEWRGVTWK